MPAANKMMGVSTRSGRLKFEELLTLHEISSPALSVERKLLVIPRKLPVPLNAGPERISIVSVACRGSGMGELEMEYCR